MAKSAADRQREYRRRHLIDGDAERLNTVVSVQAKRQLERLARHRATTQRDVLESLLASAERRAVGRMTDSATYFDGE